MARPSCVFLIFVFFLLSTVSTISQAACKGINCACKPSELQFTSPQLAPNPDGQFPISLEADNVEAQGENLVMMSGNAEVTQGRQTIVADTLQYYRQTERVVAEGNVEMISENGDYLSSDSIDVVVPTQIGQLNNTQFKLASALTRSEGVDTVQIQSRGSAGTVNLEGEGMVRLENATYTTCPEGNESVLIGARELQLDRFAGVGRAKGATIRFKGVPIFYAPYLSFPINDQRKTGFLTPGFGSDEESGNFFDVPWYWNIAKNQDATITPRYYTDRGIQVGAEYRHRSLNSSTYVYGEVLPNDELYEDETRSMLSLQHFQQFNGNLSGQINYNDVSDIDYFNDLRNEVRYFSATYVPRDAQLNYSNSYFRVQARANQYQIIDNRVNSAQQPYERLPSLSLSTSLPEGPMGIKYGLRASYNNFKAGSLPEGSSAVPRVDGTRLAFTPYVELPMEKIWGYLKPRVSVHNRSYSLNNVAPGRDDKPSFTVPVFSLDSGIYFEKNTHWFGDGALQTLEPRLFYVYAPEEDQKDVPSFDTSQIVLNNFGNIFRDTRFFGEDRVGDTNQVTIGLTSRIIDNESGDERLKFNLGQLYLLDDLKQNIQMDRTIKKGAGDLLAELHTNSGYNWGTYSFMQYSHDLGDLVTARFALNYRPKDDSRKNISVGYYFRKGLELETSTGVISSEDIDQLTVNANWPISDRWQFFGSGRYSLERSENIASTAGVEYNGCCWKLRFMGSERIDSRRFRNKTEEDDKDRKTAFFVELELTSLGRFRTGFN